jgi:hypothetical protein
VEGESKKADGKAKKDRPGDVKAADLKGALDIGSPDPVEELAEKEEAMPEQATSPGQVEDEGDFFIKVAAAIPFYVTDME